MAGLSAVWKYKKHKVCCFTLWVVQQTFFFVREKTAMPDG